MKKSKSSPRRSIVKSGDSMPFVPEWERKRGVRRWMRDASHSPGTSAPAPIRLRENPGPLPAQA